MCRCMHLVQHEQRIKRPNRARRSAKRGYALSQIEEEVMNDDALFGIVIDPLWNERNVQRILKDTNRLVNILIDVLPLETAPHVQTAIWLVTHRTFY